MVLVTFAETKVTRVRATDRTSEGRAMQGAIAETSTPLMHRRCR